MTTTTQLTLSALVAFFTGFTSAYTTAYVQGVEIAWTPCIISGVAAAASYLGAALTLKPTQLFRARPASAAKPGVL